MVCGLYGLSLMGFTIAAQLLGEHPWWFALLRNFAPYYFLPLVLLIPLALIMRARRAAAVLLPAAALGFGWFSAYFVPKYPPSLDANFRAVTLNVGDFNTSLEGIAAWLQVVNADVLLLQELPTGWAGDQIAALSGQYPYQTIQNAESFRYGNAILSRHPILETTNLHLQRSDRFVQQRAVVVINGLHIVVYNIHLEPVLGDAPRFEPRRFYSPILWMMLAYDNTRRDEQFRQIADLVRGETLPVLVGGDFNTSEHSSSYSALASVLRDSFREVGVGLGGTWPKGGSFGTPGWLPPLLRIDYLWHSEDFTTLGARVGPALSSDHLPVITDYALNGSSQR